MLTKVCLVKAMVFPVVMYGCESWSIKKAEGRRIDNFWIVVLEKTLESWESLGLQGDPTSQSILKEISPGCSLERLMLRLKLQYFGHLMRTADSLERPWCWERLRAGGEGDDTGWDDWMASQTRWTWVLSKLRELVKDKEAWRASVHWVTKNRTWLSNWTKLNWTNYLWPLRRNERSLILFYG